jgi:hypothetical protein
LTRLTPAAEELVRAGREAFRPSAADRERVFQALLPSVGSGIAAGGTAPSAAAAAASGTGVIVKATAALVAVGVAGGALILALRGGPAPERPASTAPAVSVAVASAPKPPETAPSPVPQASSAEKRAPVASSRPADNLAEEVAILSRASAELHAGRPAAALQALEEHRRIFPRGILAQERTSARVQALCALGRMKQAQVELAQLVRSSPNSPHVARARKACGSKE